VIQRLFEAIRTISQQPDFVARMRPLGYGTEVSQTTAAVAKLIQDEAPRWRELVEISGARVD
jgi:tripartite-type tricarboxylate transporter receptor subunit TctC